MYTSKNIFKSLSIASLIVLTAITWSGCSNKNNSNPNGNNSLGSAGGDLPPPADQNASTCDPANPSVTDFFTGNTLNITKSYNRYEKYIGHTDGVIKAYTHSGLFTAYNKSGNTLHVEKGPTTDLAHPGTIIADIDVKSPIQDLAFSSSGGSLKLLVGTRHNLQIYNVGDANLALASSSNLLDGINDIEVSDNKTFITNLKGDVFFTPNDNCMNVSFSRIYDATSDHDNVVKHDYVAHKVKALGDKVFILTRNRDEYDVNIALTMKMFTGYNFYAWNNKVRFVNLSDKSNGLVKATTGSTPNVSVTDIAVSQNKLYMAVNEFPQSISYTANFNTDLQNYRTCMDVTPAPPPGTCTFPGATLTNWMLMYFFSRSGVMVQDASTDFANNEPIFNKIDQNGAFLGFIYPLNTGLFYSPRITIAGDVLYMTGIYAMESLNHLSTGNTTWDTRINLEFAPGSPPTPPNAHVPLTYPVSMDFWDDSARRVGLFNIDDYTFSSDTPAGDAKSGFLSAVLLPTDQGRGADSQHSDVYQFAERYQALDQSTVTNFTLTPGGAWLGSAVSKGASPADDRAVYLTHSGFHYTADKFDPYAATPVAAEASKGQIFPNRVPPLYTVMKMLPDLRSTDDGKYSFFVTFDTGTNQYAINAIQNSFTNASNPNEVFSPDASGIAIPANSYPMGFQKIVSTSDSYILYINTIKANPSLVYYIDRVVISKASMLTAFGGAATAPNITELNSIQATGPLISIFNLFAMDADENYVYILGVDGVLTKKDKNDAVIGSPINVYNFSGGTKIIAIPPRIVVNNGKAYTNGLYINTTPSTTDIGLGYAITDLTASPPKSYVLPEVQYLSIHGAEHLLGASLLNENGSELFDF